MIPTPDLTHLKRADYDRVYEPAEDTFALLDALEGDAERLRTSKPRLCVEIGPGSGCVTAFVGAILGATTCAYLTLDINEHASIATEATGKQNGVSISAVGSNMLSAIEQRARGHIDLLIFNPPYVPTTEEEEKQAQAWAEADGGQLSASWAGGSMGTRLLDMLIHGNGFCATPLHEVLAVGGKFYLVAIRQNKPESIVETLKGKGLQAEIVLSRRAGGEHLFIIRAERTQ